MSDHAAPDFETGATANTGKVASVTPATEADTPVKESYAAEETRGGMFSALRHKNFRYFWTGAAVSNIGNWMQTVGQNWLVLSLVNSSFVLGLVNFVGNLPTLLLGLFGGVVADRSSRRKVLMLTQTAMMVAVFIEAALAFTNHINLWMVLIIVLIIGIAQAFNGPAYQTIVLDLVGKKDLMNAIALNSVQFNLSRIIGPSIAGGLVVVVGVAACFFLNGLSFLAVLVALFFIKLPPPPAREGNKNALAEIREGLSYLGQNRALLTLLALSALFSILVFPYTTLLTVFAKNVFTGGADSYGWLLAGVGLGALVGALTAARLSHIKRRSTFLIVGASLDFVALWGLALAPNLLTAMFIVTLAGGATVTIMNSMNVIVQTNVPATLRGRVMSVWTICSLGLFPLGNLVMGSLAQVWGAPAAIAFGVTTYGLVCAMAFWRVPGMRKY